ncbi:MAG: helix-turn-helix domain-containing protein [Chloroflexota bacterium]|nr:helix-turn-helix domain-containing protein [Chloroflexota bacterium]
MSDFLTADQAATEAGMDRRALERRLRQRGLPRYRDPRDGRRILIARADFAEFLTPRPINEARQQREVSMPSAA